MSDLVTLPDEPREAFKSLSSYLSSVRTDSDRRVKRDGELVGFWQTPEWCTGLIELATETSRLSRASQWIACSYRMPEGERMVAFSTASGVKVGYRLDATGKAMHGHWRDEPLRNWHKPEEVTHWQPLPEPPKP